MRTGWTVAVAVLVGSLLAGCGEGQRVADGLCAAGPDQRSIVSAVEPRTGIIVWSRSLPHPRSEPARVSGDLVLLRGCRAVVMGGTDGRVLARRDADDVVGIAGGSVVSFVDGDVVADPVRGGGARLRAGSSPPWTGAAVAGRLVVVSTDGGGLHALDVTQPGSNGWDATLTAAGEQPDVRVAGDGLVLAAAEGSLYRLDAETGRISWRVLPAAPDTAYRRLLTTTSAVALVEVGEQAAAVDLATGEERWRTPLPEGTTPQRWAAGGGVVVVAEQGGLVVARDLASGAELWHRERVAVSPVVEDGLVLLDDERSLTAYDLRTGTVRWARSTRNRPLLTGGAGHVVVVDSPAPRYLMNDCC